MVVAYCKRGCMYFIIMAHPVVVDDELGASPFFLRSLWLTMHNQNSERHSICCDRQQVFPMTVERCVSPPCHAWWRLCSAVWVCQFYEARYRTRCRGYPWAGDHLPYGGRGLASADVAALCMHLHLWKRWISFSYVSLHRWHCGLREGVFCLNFASTGSVFLLRGLGPVYQSTCRLDATPRMPR